MDYIICIPSYRRAKICNERTLKTLHHHDIPAEKIKVYVADTTEYELYEKTLDKSFYGELIVGMKGIVSQRQFISNHNIDGEWIVSIDDDVEKIDLTLSPSFVTASLDDFIKTAFKTCVENQAFIWGVNPVYNPFFRTASEGRKQSTEMTLDLKFIVGAFYGFINRPSLQAIKLKVADNKEDVERSIRYFINDGRVVRYNVVAFKTKYYGTDGGGLGKLADRLGPMKIEAEKLKAEFPTYGNIRVKKNGMTEFNLRKIKAFEVKSIVVEATQPAEMFTALFEMLSKITVKSIQGRSNRRGFPEKHRAFCFGITRGRFNGVVGLSMASKKYPDIYDEIMRIGKIICPFDFNSIHLNHNVVCPKHYDSKNVGESMLVSFGDYTGCNIVIEGIVYDAKHTPVIFNGSKREHWNTDDLTGNKYSLVFYKNEDALK